MKIFFRNYLLFILLSFLTLFSCVEKSTTDSNNSSTTSLSIDYEISENFYIALTNTVLELIQKTDFGSQSNFSVSPTLPNGLSLDVTNGNISGTPTNSSQPTPYTVTATKDNKNYIKTISLGIAPSIAWVTSTNSSNPYQLTAFVVGDRAKQINDWVWNSSDDTLATVSNGMVSFKPTNTRRTVVISATNSNYSNEIAFTVSKVEEVNGEKIITDDEGNVYLSISTQTKTITSNQFQSQSLTRLVIPDSITNIGSRAFLNNQLTSIVIPNSIKELKHTVFALNHLKSVVIPNSVTHIGSWAFQNNRLTSLLIPNSVTDIGDHAFRDNQLTSVVIGKNVKTIGDKAFQNNQLNRVVIPNSITNINGSTFRLNQLTNVVIPNSVINIDSSAFNINQLTSVMIPNSVTHIGNAAFTDNPYLVEVSLKQSLYTKITNTSTANAVFGTQVTNYIKRP